MLKFRIDHRIKGTTSPKQMQQLLESKLENSHRPFKFEVPNFKWCGQVMPVVVENAETLDENKYLIPSKEQKREWSMF